MARLNATFLNFSLRGKTWDAFWMDGGAVIAPAAVTGHGGLHHISEGMGDVGDGPRVPQTLHTIEYGITTP